MKLSREELKDISAGAEAVEYGNLVAILTAIVTKIVNFLKGLFS
jgi:hypothetical protein